MRGSTTQVAETVLDAIGSREDVVVERLDITADEIDAGHCVALSRPDELAARLDGYL